MQMLNSKGGQNDRFTGIKISEEGPEITQEQYNNLMKLTNDLMFIIKRYIAAEIHLKRSKNNEPLSEIAQKVIDVHLVPAARKRYEKFKNI